jgi:hypothetical protein
MDIIGPIEGIDRCPRCELIDLPAARRIELGRTIIVSISHCQIINPVIGIPDERLFPGLAPAWKAK